MKKKTAATAIEPTDTIGSIFIARRDLLQGVKYVVRDSKLTVEEADLLVSLFGVRELRWDDLPHDEAHYVAFKNSNSSWFTIQPAQPPHPQAGGIETAAGGGRQSRGRSALQRPARAHHR